MIDKKKALFSALLASGLTLFSFSSRADDSTEILRAQAYVALGDELYAMAQSDSDNLAKLLTDRGVVGSDAGYTYTAQEASLLADYTSLATEAGQL